MGAPDAATHCEYTFDPTTRADVPDDASLSFLNDDGVWHCPHTPHENRDRCPFHLPPPDTPAGLVEQRFFEAVERTGERPKQFIGAELSDFDLERTVVECADNYPIDFRYATFSGTTTLEYSIVRQPLNLEGATFEGRAEFTETRFRNEVYLSGAAFDQDARFFATRFTQGVWCYETVFEQADFHGARFGDAVDFTQARFDRCHFQGAEFTARASFDGATFGHASLPGARFHDDVSFDDAVCPERVNLQHSEFTAIASFDQPTPLDETTCFDLQDATITAGRLVPPQAAVVFDLRNATLGDVALAAGQLSPALFDRFRLLNTTFEGFDFGAYREVLNEADWEIHHAMSLPELETVTPSAGELEGTYLKAKNGANAIGDTKAAAEFFRKEMLFRRHQYVPTIRSGAASDRVVAAWRWTANALLDATSGYGERPSRVVASAGGVVLLFALLFSVTMPAPPYERPIGYLIVSLESFITLVLGGAAPIRDPRVRLFAEIEGFVGAFLIALFVFTLTRSIHR